MAGSFSEILGQETNGNYTIKGSLTNEVSDLLYFAIRPTIESVISASLN